MVSTIKKQDKKAVLGKSFEVSLLSEELKNITGEVSEAILDSTLEDGLLKELPIIGSALGVFRIGKSIKDIFYLKKLHKFLYELKDISSEVKQEFVNRVAQHGEKKKYDLFEKILFLIDRHDDIEKSQIVGKLFAAMVKSDIDTDSFLRLSVTIDKTYLTDLQYLAFRYAKKGYMTKEERLIFYEKVDQNVCEEGLTGVGLLRVQLNDNVKFILESGETMYDKRYLVSDMGKILSEHGF